MHIKSKIAFWLALFALLLTPLFFPRLHLLFFAPYLVICIYKMERLAVLWRALWCGLLLDLFSTTPYFGLAAINYVLVVFVLYKQKWNFFEDKLSTLPLVTALFSLLTTLVSALFFLLFGEGLIIQPAWLISDLIGMSLIDGFYALLLFSLPFQITYKVRRMWLTRKKRESD